MALPEDFPASKPHHVTRSEANAIRAHLHPCFELGYCHEGSGIFLIGEKMLHCGPGDAVAIREGEMHLLVSPEGASTRWSFVNLDCLGLLAGALREPGDAASAPFASAYFRNVIESARNPELCLLVKELIEELDQERPGRRRAAVALLWALLVKLRRLSSAPDAPVPGSESKRVEETERLRPALREIADKFAQELSAKRLAKLCRMSDANFRRLFHKQFGASPRDYILRLRLEVAKSLLRNSALPVLELSLKAGFPSLSNFNRQFKRFAGCAPRQFRQGKDSLLA